MNELVIYDLFLDEILIIIVDFCRQEQANRTMIEHIIGIKPTIDNRTPTSYIAKKGQLRSEGGLINGSESNTFLNETTSDVSQSKDLSKSTIKVNRAARER